MALGLPVLVPQGQQVQVKCALPRDSPGLAPGWQEQVALALVASRTTLCRAVPVDQRYRLPVVQVVGSQTVVAHLAERAVVRLVQAWALSQELWARADWAA